MSEENTNSKWPLPEFYFKVKFASQDQTASFQEISGLETENQEIEYGQVNNNQTTTISKPGNVSLKKGIFVDDGNFFDWCDTVEKNTINKEKVCIQLLDEKGSPRMTWTLMNAWPTKISGADLKSDRNEVAIETLELAYETLSIAKE